MSHHLFMNQLPAQPGVGRPEIAEIIARLDASAGGRATASVPLDRLDPGGDAVATPASAKPAAATSAAESDAELWRLMELQLAAADAATSGEPRAA